MMLAAGVIAILIFPVIVYALDPAHRTPLFPVALGAYLALGLGLLAFSFTQRPAVRPGRAIDEHALNRRLTVGALLAAIVIANFALLEARTLTPFIAAAAVAWSLLWLLPAARRVSIKTSMVINRDVKTVFGFMADQRNEPQYTPEIVSVEKITDGDIGPGTQFRSTVRMDDGGTFQGVDQILEMEWGHRIMSSLVSGARPNRGVMIFQPMGAATQLSYEYVDEVPYPAALLGLSILRWTTTGGIRRRRMERWARLKQLLESRSDT